MPSWPGPSLHQGARACWHLCGVEGSGRVSRYPKKGNGGWTYGKIWRFMGKHHENIMFLFKSLKYGWAWFFNYYRLEIWFFNYFQWAIHQLWRRNLSISAGSANPSCGKLLSRSTVQRGFPIVRYGWFVIMRLEIVPTFFMNPQLRMGQNWRHHRMYCWSFLLAVKSKNM